jgi:multisubunit Na+/H+ antiporter MnhF subunit
VIGVAYIVLSLAALLFLLRLLIGPSVPDRVIALDGILITVMCGVLVAAADARSSIGIDTVLVVALMGFVGTGVLARYVERRGG